MTKFDYVGLFLMMRVMNVENSSIKEKVDRYYEKQQRTTKIAQQEKISYEFFKFFGLLF